MSTTTLKTLGSAPAINRGADQWFRELGLPTFVPLRRWFTDLPRRVAPLILWVTIISLLLRDALDETIAASVELLGEVDGWLVSLSVVVIVLISAALAWAGYGILRAVLRRVPRAAGNVIAGLMIVACLAAVIIVGYATDPRATVSPVVGALGILLLCALVTGMGGGALVSWAARLAVRNASAVSNMASIALPVILMLVVFAFFSAEVWQMATALTPLSLTLVGLFVGGLAVAVVLRVCASEIDEMKQKLTREERAAMLVDSPAANRELVSDATQPLGLAQRGNILLVMAVAQLLQALFFAGLLWTLLVVLGAVAVPPGVIGLWLGDGSSEQPMTIEYVSVGGVTLPLTYNLFKAAALLSLIATLPFVFSAVSEQRYRERFFDPIMADMRRAIVVRDALTAPHKPRRSRDRGDEVRTSPSA